MAEAREGQLVGQYAARLGWRLRSRNIMVEGEGDVEYFQLASDLHARETGLVLLDAELSVFCPGIGDDGGSYGIQRQFPVIRTLTDVDLSRDGKRLFRVVALLDSDPHGKQAARALTAQHMRLRQCQDVFLLHRRFPMSPTDPEGLQRALARDNSDWHQIDCVIEDLVHVDLIELFLDENPRYRPARPFPRAKGAVHCCFERHAKAPFRRFVKDNAQVADVRSIIDVLRAMRVYLGLAPDGTAQR